MKVLKYIIIITIPLLFASCVKEPLYDALPEVPINKDVVSVDSLVSDFVQTKILVKIDWQDATPQLLNGTFELKVGDTILSLSLNEQPDTFLIEPGNCSISLYNHLQGITSNHQTADMNRDGNGYIIAPTTGKFFSCAKNITADTGTYTEVNIKPILCTRKLFINLNIPYEILNDTINPIVTVKGKLGNIARSFDMKTLNEQNAEILFFDGLDSISQFSAAIFGLIGENQMLTIEVRRLLDSVKTAHVDLSTELTNFNTDKIQDKYVSLNYLELSFVSKKQGINHTTNKSVGIRMRKTLTRKTP